MSYSTGIHPLCIRISPPYVKRVCEYARVCLAQKLRCSGLGRSLKRRLRKSTDLIDEITTAVEITLTPVNKIFIQNRISKPFLLTSESVCRLLSLVDRLPCGPGAHHARSAELECSPNCCTISRGIGAALQATGAVVAHHALQSTDAGNRAQSYLRRLKFVGNVW